MFASSFNMHTIVEFDENETPVQTITSGGMAQPRSLAFAPPPEPAIPAVSTYGLAVMVLTLIAAGTVLLSRRHSVA